MSSYSLFLTNNKIFYQLCISPKLTLASASQLAAAKTQNLATLIVILSTLAGLVFNKQVSFYYGVNFCTLDHI